MFNNKRLLHEPPKIKKKMGNYRGWSDHSDKIMNEVHKTDSIKENTIKFFDDVKGWK